MPAVNAKYHFSAPGIDYYATYQYPGNKRLNKYPVGVAIMEFPFFIIAKYYCYFTHQFDDDGYSLPFQLAIIFATIFWAVIGLVFLRLFLLRYFSEGVTTFTLLCIAFGTNLFNYSAFDFGMSHPFSFALFAVLLYITDGWYRLQRPYYLYILGIILGLITITRPINIVVLIIPLLWRINNIRDFLERVNHIKINIFSVALSFLFFFLIIALQLSYWKLITGHWICYSYGDEGFSFLRPEIINGLFSYRKGWFVYTPIALLGISGFIFLWKSHKDLVPAMFIFVILMVYIVFSWHPWWYGGSFGCRPLIEVLAILALPFAAFCNDIYRKGRNHLLQVGFAVLACFFVFLNIFQTYQFSVWIIPWDRTTKKYYWAVFLNLSPSPKAQQYLMSDAEYQKSIDDMNK